MHCVWSRSSLSTHSVVETDVFYKSQGVCQLHIFNPDIRKRSNEIFEIHIYYLMEKVFFIIVSTNLQNLGRALCCYVLNNFIYIKTISAHDAIGLCLYNASRNKKELRMYFWKHFTVETVSGVLLLKFSSHSH